MNTHWYHLAITVDATNAIKLYKDAIIRNEVINATLGIGSADLNGQNYLGNIDDLILYKKALSPTEIQHLFAIRGDCYTCL